MSAAQFVIDHILTVLGGSAVVVTALATYLGKLLSDKSILREKNSLEKQITKLKNQHETSMKLLEKEVQLELVKNNQFHQISKSTYAKLFNKKIDVYTELLKLKVEFDKFRFENGAVEFMDPSDDYLGHFNSLKKQVELNRLYITNDLAKVYDDWYEDAADYFARLQHAYYEVCVTTDPANERDDTPERVWDAQSPIIKEMVSKTIGKMEILLQQIEKDVGTIRDAINQVTDT